jgi:hypothetical protein
MLLDFKSHYNTFVANHYCQTLKNLHNKRKKKCPAKPNDGMASSYCTVPIPMSPTELIKTS